MTMSIESTACGAQAWPTWEPNEILPGLWQGGTARGCQLTGDGIGVDQIGAKAYEMRGNRTFSAADAARQPNAIRGQAGGIHRQLIS